MKLVSTYGGRNHTHLSASVAELRESCVEETVLPVKWSYICICMGLSRLEGHVCIGDFGNRRAEIFKSGLREGTLHNWEALTSKRLRRV
jgi:hypothetical protein